MAEFQFPPITVVLTVTAEVVREVVHRCPIGRSGTMPCCGRTPFERLADRMTIHPELVTCKGRAVRGDGE